MDIQSQHWVALKAPVSPRANCYQFVKTFDNKKDTGIFAVITEALASSQLDGESPQSHQRSQQGSELAIKAARQAFDDLLERQLDFESFFLDLLAKHWHNQIHQHFSLNPVDTIETEALTTSSTTTSDKNHPSNLSELYDTTISIVRLTSQQLMVYQIGYAQLLLLNQQHEIQLSPPKIDPVNPQTPFLSHPNLKEVYACQFIDIVDNEPEMLVLLSKQYIGSRTQEQLHDEAFNLSRSIDTKGGSYAKQYFEETQGNACRVIIKRNRRWYDGLSSALERESYYLHGKLDQQNQHISQLKSQIAQLRQTTLQITTAQELQDKEEKQQLYISSHNFTQELEFEKQQEKIKFIPLGIALSALALLASSLIAYYLWDNQPIREKVYPHKISKAGLSTQYSRNKAGYEAIEEAPTLNDKGRITKQVDSSVTAPETTKNRQIQEQIHLETIQKDIIVQQIIGYSTAFAEHTFKLDKKAVEINAMNELFTETKSKHYSRQIAVLEKREEQLNQKMNDLSQQYSQQLKRLCDYPQPYNPSLSTEASPLEKIALRYLKQQLSDCTQSENISATQIGKILRSSYQNLDIVH